MAGRAGKFNDAIQLAIVSDQADFEHAVGKELGLNHSSPSVLRRRGYAKRPGFGLVSGGYMRLMKSARLRWWRIGVVVSVSACTQAYQVDHGLAEDNPTSMTVPVGVRADSAQIAVQDRAVRGGFTITNAAPGLVTIGPYALKQDAGVQVTLRINLLGDSARVSGTVTDALSQSIGASLAGAQGVAHGTNQPIRYAISGRFAWSWSELERLATAIRAPR